MEGRLYKYTEHITVQCIYCSIQTYGKTRERILLAQGVANCGRKHTYRTSQQLKYIFMESFH